MNTVHTLFQKPLTRRAVMGGMILGSTFLGIRATQANSAVGKVNEVQGSLFRRQSDLMEDLKGGDVLNDNDLVATGTDSFADLLLGQDTRIQLGANTELLVDSFIANQGGTLELASGQMVFDRAEGLPKIDLSLRTAFGMIGVRGTKFFAGPSQGVFSVFVEHGRVEVQNAGVTRSVARGEGIEFPSMLIDTRSFGSPEEFRELARQAEPSVPKKWGEGRIRQAFSSVGLK